MRSIPALASAAALTLAWCSEAEASTAFISNEKDNTVSVFDTEAGKVVKTIPVGKRPRGMVLTPDFKQLIVCAGDDNRIDIIDTEKLVVASSHETSGPDPELLDIDHQGKILYIANEDDGMVTVIGVDGSPKAEIQIGVEPEGMSVSPDDGTVVATSESTSMAHFIDTRTLKVVANVLVDTRPRVALYTADGKEVWVTAEVGGTVSVIDAVTRKVKHKISFQIPGVRPELIQPMGVKFTLDAKRAVVALGRANRIAVIDTSTYEVLEYVLVGQRPWHIALSADGSKLYTANGLSNDLTIVNTKTWKPEKSIPVGRLPWGIVLKP